MPATTPKVSVVLVLLIAVTLMDILTIGAEYNLNMRTDLKNANASFIGEDASDNSGYAVALVGDVNGDGFDDMAIGASGDDDAANAAGEVYIIFGKASGWSTDMDLSKADASFTGEHANDQAGMSVGGGGDVNGDGFDDILIGAPADDDVGADAGQVYLIFGNSTGWKLDVSLSNAGASFRGEHAGDTAGDSVDIAGDVNSDGYDDIVIGASSDSDGMVANRGQAYVILGKIGAWAMDTSLSASSGSYLGEHNGDLAGRSVSGAGDVNKDGYDDILIGAVSDDDAHMNAGQAYLVIGKAGGWMMDVGLGGVSSSWRGEDIGDAAGVAVAGIGDINNDGYDDIAVGANGRDEGGNAAGQTYIILGQAILWAMDQDLSAADASLWGENGGDNSGCSISYAGDINADGYEDFLIGASGNSDGGAGAGQAYLILGRATAGWTMDMDLQNSDASFIGEGGGDAAGRSVSGGWDANGDGTPDILIDAYNDDDGGADAGQTYLILSNALPPAPTNLKAWLSGDGTSISMNWSAPTYWTKPITGYRVLRSSDGTNYNLLGTVAPGNLKYKDTDVIVERYYYYAIETVDSLGDLSGRSTIVSLMCDNDTDLDTVGNLVDLDDDGDGVPDGQDAFPLDNTEWLDTDLDGTGNAADGDDDNDGILDALDAEPLNPLNSIEDKIDFLNATLEAVKGLVQDINSDLLFMNTTLIGLNDNLTSMNASVTDMMADIGSNINGMNSTIVGMLNDAASDLYGLNFTLQSRLAAVNSSLSARLGSLSTQISGMNGTLLARLSDLNWTLGNVSKDIGGMNTSLHSDHVTIVGLIDALSDDVGGMNSTMHTEHMDLEDMLGDLSGDLNGMNSSIHADHATLQGLLNNVSDDIDGLNSTIKKDHNAMQNLLNKVNSNLTTLISLVSQSNDKAVLSALKNLSGNVSAMNRSLHKSMVDMEDNLTADLLTLDLALDAVNGSLHDEMAALDSNVKDFRTEVATDLREILDLLKALDLNVTVNQTGNVSKEIRELERLINTMNSTTLAQIIERLSEVEKAVKTSGGDTTNVTKILQEIAKLDVKVNDFRAETRSSLANITKLLAALDKIDGLVQDVGTMKTDLTSVMADISQLKQLDSKLTLIENDIKDLKKQQGETKNAVQVSSTGTPIALILLLGLVLVMVGVNFWRVSDLKGHTTASSRKVDLMAGDVHGAKASADKASRTTEDLGARVDAIGSRLDHQTGQIARIEEAIRNIPTRGEVAVTPAPVPNVAETVYATPQVETPPAQETLPSDQESTEAPVPAEEVTEVEPEKSSIDIIMKKLKKQKKK